MKGDHHTASFDKARVRAALAGKLDAETLTAKERKAFEELWGQAFEQSPSLEMVAFMADLRERGGSVGYDDAGNYVRGLPDGKTEILESAALLPDLAATLAQQCCNLRSDQAEAQAIDFGNAAASLIKGWE